MVVISVNSLGIYSVVCLVHKKLENRKKAAPHCSKSSVEESLSSSLNESEIQLIKIILFTFDGHFKSATKVKNNAVKSQ